MKNLRLFIIMLLVVVAASGCGGSSLPQSGLSASQQVRTASGASGDLLYVAHGANKGAGYGGRLSVLTFPQGKHVGTIALSGFATGTCADTSGDLWAIVGNSQHEYRAFEYAHGGTVPIAKIRIGRTDNTTDCAVDPTTGNLAVLTGVYEGSGPAYIDVWAGARQGKPVRYPINFTPISCGYDASGNLFLDGYVGSTVFFELAELSKGSRSVANVKTTFFNFPGGVQWDGQYIAVFSGTKLYRLSVSGYVAKVVATVNFRNAYYGTPFDVANGVAVADRGGYGHDVSLWQYPRGGKATKTVARLQYTARGLTISLGSTR